MNLFIIGSGFTKAIFPEAPLNNELLAALSSENSDCSSQVLLRKYETNDIEIALTKLDADIATSCHENKQLFLELQDIRHKIEIGLGNYFTSYRATHQLLEESPWLKEFMQSVCTSVFIGSIIISESLLVISNGITAILFLRSVALEVVLEVGADVSSLLITSVRPLEKIILLISDFSISYSKSSPEYTNLIES